MQTRVPPLSNGQPVSPRSRRVWPWAVGSIAIPLIVIAATLLGARYVARQRLAAQVTPAPSLPPLRVDSVFQPENGVGLWTLTRNQSEIAAYSYATPSMCIPDTPCKTGQKVNQFTLYPAIGPFSTPTLTRYIAQSSVSDCSLLTDETPQTDTLALVCPNLVQVIAADTATPLNQFLLPAGLDTIHATLDSTTNTLYLTGNGALHAYDLATGAEVATQSLSGSPSQPIVDTTRGVDRVYVLQTEQGGSAPSILAAFDARTLNPLGAMTVPADWRAGPFNGALYLFGKGGAVGELDLNAPSWSLSAPYSAATIYGIPKLKGARALGWSGSGGAAVVFALYADHVTAFKADTLTPYGSAPISGAWDSQRALPLGNTGVIYVPDASGAVVGLDTAAFTKATAPDSATAIMLARAGLGKLLPDTNQTPAFLSAETFPLAPGRSPGAGSEIAQNFAIHYSDLGWRGPYGGTASAKVISGAQATNDQLSPTSFTVAFTVTWNQLFVHTHTWTVELLPDGQVKMLSDTGDALP